MVLVDPDIQRRRVRLLVTIVLVGTVSAIAYHYIAGFYHGLGYPQSTFLFIPGDHFNDWDNSYGYAASFLRGDPAPSIYFPFAFLAMVIATLLPMRVGFALLILVFLVVLVLMLQRWVLENEEHLPVKVQYAFILVVLSYPVVFAIDRTNVDLLLFVFVAGFFYFLYERESPWLAAICLAVAIAFKIYPATLLLVLLAERRYRSASLTVVLALAFTLIGLVALSLIGGHSIAGVWQMSTGEKDVYQQIQVIDGGGLQHGHTLWGLLRTPGFLWGAAVQGWQTTAYSVAAALIFLVLAYHVVFREAERWKRVLLAVVPALLLPFVSVDYTLIYLYFPLVFFLRAPRVSRWDIVYLVLFGVLLIPVDYYYLTLAKDGISISVIVYPIALLALVVLAVLDRQKVPEISRGESSVPRRMDGRLHRVVTRESG